MARFNYRKPLENEDEGPMKIPIEVLYSMKRQELGKLQSYVAELEDAIAERDAIIKKQEHQIKTYRGMLELRKIIENDITLEVLKEERYERLRNEIRSLKQCIYRYQADYQKISQELNHLKESAV